MLGDRIAKDGGKLKGPKLKLKVKRGFGEMAHAQWQISFQAPKGSRDMGETPMARRTLKRELRTCGLVIYFNSVIEFFKFLS